MKKCVKLFTCAILSLCFCWFIGQHLKQTRTDTPEQQTESKIWNLFDHMDSDETVLWGRTESTDYPFGYNVGLIEDEEVGCSVLLTPDTKLTTNCTVPETASLELSFQIHPWVSDDSDGALLHITITSMSGNQEFVYKAEKALYTEVLSLNEFGAGNLQFEFTVTNEEDKNENCDWVIIRHFSISTEK